MKNILFLHIILVSSLLGYAHIAAAQSVSTSSGILLRTNPSARAEGMAAHAAVATDEAGALASNPASLDASGGAVFGSAYYRGLVDDNFGGLYAASEVIPQLTAGGAFYFYDAGRFDLVTDAGETSTLAGQRDFLLGLSAAYGMEVAKSPLVLGASLKFLHSTLLEQYSAFAVGVDLGARLELKPLADHLFVAAAVKNFGTPMKYLEAADALPASLLAGVAYQAFQNNDLQVLVAGDSRWDMASTWQGALGAEVLIAKMIAVRAGYQLGYALASLTAGFGLAISDFQLDYSFGLMQSLNATHRVGLTYTVAKPKPLEEAADEPEAPVVEDAPNVEANPDQNASKLPVAILEIQKMGGKPSKVIMNAGAKMGVRPGLTGIIVSSNGVPLTSFTIELVDPEKSLGQLMDTNRNIPDDATAIIQLAK